MGFYLPKHNVLNYQQSGLRIMPETEKGEACSALQAFRFELLLCPPLPETKSLMYSITSFIFWMISAKLLWFQKFRKVEVYFFMAKLTLEYWEDDGWLVGRLVEVPGVFSQGETHMTVSVTKEHENLPSPPFRKLTMSHIFLLDTGGELMISCPHEDMRQGF